MAVHENENKLCGLYFLVRSDSVYEHTLFDKLFPTKKRKKRSISSPETCVFPYRITFLPSIAMEILIQWNDIIVVDEIDKRIADITMIFEIARQIDKVILSFVVCVQSC